MKHISVPERAICEFGHRSGIPLRCLFGLSEILFARFALGVNGRDIKLFLVI